MLVATGSRASRGKGDAAGTATDRPRPKRPDVLVTTAATGAGVPELLAAIDRHRATGQVAIAETARLARAEAQVWAILADRLRARLHAPATTAATTAILRDVADHRLDPYAAADTLLESILRRDG
jgi:LAO/AO transport system kinase